MPSEDDDVVVSRRFERDDGDVLLLIHKPKPWVPKDDPRPDDPAFRCLYTIRFPDGEIKQRSVVGLDSMQAFLLALAAASSGMRNMGNGTPEKRPPLRYLGGEDLGLTISHFD